MENSFENENLTNSEGSENTEAESREEKIERAKNEEVQPKTKEKKSMQREILEWIVALAVAVVLAFIIRTYFFNIVKVNGSSMDNTLHDGQRLVVLRLNYEPEQGDIVVFTPDLHPKTPFIKRIIATEGQTVDIDSRGIVYVDGKVYDEEYIYGEKTLLSDVKFPITVPDDCVFVMGDNRTPNGSHDGRSLDVSSIKEENITEDDYYEIRFIDEDMMIKERREPLYYGCVHKDDIMGRAAFRFWPFDGFGTLR